MKEFVPERKLGLLGYPLGHSFSKRFFEQKFQDESLKGWSYQLLERSGLDGLKAALSGDPSWQGFNVTIPHKQNILSLLDSLDPQAARIGAVNVVKIMPDGSWRGYNSDAAGFRLALLNWLPAGSWKEMKAIVLGNGGSAKAVHAVLDELEMQVSIFARRPEDGQFPWEELSSETARQADLLVNCTPLGMSPAVHNMPLIPENAFRKGQFVFDLIYNPDQTRFLELAVSFGANTQNGLAMLHHQAEIAWQIWTQPETGL